MSLSLLLLAAAVDVPSRHIPSSPELGVAEGRCRPGETGPALQITLAGLKDRQGRVRAELYPANDQDFLGDDNKLIMAGKTFRRVELELPQAGPVTMCLRTPGPGAYTLSLLHDRDSNRKFGLSVDGVGFANDPKLGWSKPRADKVTVHADGGLTRLTVTMQYRRGLFSFGPLKKN
jgi:uncharacterized protein (DUF2141 family)